MITRKRLREWIANMATIHSFDAYRAADEASQLMYSRLKNSDGGGTYDGMEARVAKLEASSEFIQREVSDLKSEIRGMRSDARSDFRLLFGAIITVALGLAGLMAKGFGWI